jgi:branched-chain amino acid transport system ATP-binding protein
MFLLQINELNKHFGGVKAVDRVDLVVNQGEIVGLIGPNGAGKSTLFAVITAYLKPDNGKIVFNNENLQGLKTDQIARRGLVRTFQIVRPINEMSVIENIVVGALINTNKVSVAYRKATDILDFVGMSNKANHDIKSLTLADKKRLEIGRALATSPKIILLDEVMAGLTPSESHEATKLIKRINEELKITLVIVEHVMEVIMPLSKRVVVLDHGAKIAEGTPQEVCNDPAVIKAYLGNYSTKKGVGSYDKISQVI